jgi:hypothetical protein
MQCSGVDVEPATHIQTLVEQNMALSLGVKAGSQVRVGTSMLRVLKILAGGKSISIEVDDRYYLIGNQEKTEILPLVFVFCGIVGDWNSPLKSRLAFDAPRAVEIERIGQL